MAITSLPIALATMLLRVEKVMIEWSVCRVRPSTMVTRCFRCLGFGHVAAAYKGSDRSGLCLRCGTEGQKAAACTATELVYQLCRDSGKDAGRYTGGRRCPAYLEEVGRRLGHGSGPA